MLEQIIEDEDPFLARIPQLWIEVTWRGHGALLPRGRGQARAGVVGGEDGREAREPVLLGRGHGQFELRRGGYGHFESLCIGPHSLSRFADHF